jgi:uncharacterized protein involved in outer membrane biogenesis
MTATRKRRLWIILLAIPVVLVVGAMVALKLYFTSDRLKGIVVSRMEETTNRSIGIHDIGLSVFPSLAIRIDSMTVSNPRDGDFSETPMLALDRLTLNLKLWPLLSGNAEITSVTIERPMITLEVNAAGKGNYTMAEQTPERETDAEPTAPEAAGGALLVSDLRIRDGSLRYTDRKGNSAFSLEGMDVDLSGEYNPATSSVSLSTRSAVKNLSYGSLTSALISNLRATLNLPLEYKLADDLLVLKDGTGTVEDIALTISGTIGQLRGDPALDITIHSDKVNIAELLSLAPKEYMKAAEGLQGTGTATIHFVMSGVITDTTRPDVSGTISATGASIRYAQLPKPITNVNIVANFTRTRTTQELRVPQFSATLGNNPLSASLTVVNFDDPVLTLAVNAALNLAEVKDYYPLEEGTQLSGGLKSNVNINGKVSAPAAMRASGTMEFRNVTIKQAGSQRPVQNLNGTVTFNNQIVESRRLAMTLGRSDLALGFTMRNYLSLLTEDKKAAQPSASITLSSNALYTADLTGDEPAGQAAGSRKAGDKQKGGGVPLPNVPMDVSVTIGKLVMEKFQLDNVRGSMRIADGVMNLQNLNFNTFEGSFSTKGTLDLREPERPTFDLAMDMKNVSVNNLLTPFSSFGKRLFGNLSMTTNLKGTLDDTLGLVQQSLTGTGDAQLTSGRLTGMKVNSTISSLLNIPDLQEIAFKDWANSFLIEGGRIQIKNLRIAALGGDYLINGSHGFDGSLDYKMNLVLSEATSAKVNVPGFAGEAVNLFKNESGRVVLNFNIGGTQDDPKVQLDTQAARQRVEELAKQKLDAEKKKLEEELKRKGGDLLKDLLKKKN